jgi:dTDP-4-dehydrorhamnose reductase
VLYGQAKFGRADFVRWVVSSLREEKTIRIVNDQINNPTFIDDLVWAIDSAVNNKKYGVYHIGGPEYLDRYEFTMRIADYFGLDKSLVQSIKTEELNQKAKRPLKSGLLIQKARAELDYKPHSINDSFAKMKSELGL